MTTYYPPAARDGRIRSRPMYLARTYVTTPGTVTTRTYVGLGIFRPFGVNRDTYYTPGRTYVYP